MSILNDSHLVVMDKKGIVVGTWGRKTVVLKAGDTITVSNIGQYSVPGVGMLALDSTIAHKLLANQRVRLIEA
jgi:hypothetical protein